MVRVMIRFKNQCALSFRCEKDKVDIVTKMMIKEIKRTMDDVDEIKVTEIDE